MKTKPIKIEKDFNRPWGGFIKFIDNKPCTVKILFLKKGEILSFQSHQWRQEYWYLISGKIRVFKGPIRKTWKSIKRNLKIFILKPGETISIPKNTVHSMEGLSNSKILEISIGKFKETDEIRYQDKYGRK